MATLVGFRPTFGTYEQLLPDLDGEVGVVTEPGTTVSVGTYFFVSQPWNVVARCCLWAEREVDDAKRKTMVAVQFDSADIVSPHDGGLDVTTYDRDLAQTVTDELNYWRISAGDIIDSFTGLEIANLQVRSGVASIFATHGLTPGAPY